MAPGVNWGYTGTSTTGASQALANMNRQLQRDENGRLYERLREADAQIARLEHRLYQETRYVTGEDFKNIPEPSVEVHEVHVGWWSNLINDPFWEIFKRPKFK